MSVPYWVQDAIFYQIFPDRFYRAERELTLDRFQTWGSKPTTRGFQGGNLRGIIEKFDYLLELGVNALYLNPIFSSTANHRYHTNDYYLIDRSLGTMDEFKALVDVAHTNGVRVILDGVFNHTGRGFFAFEDILDNGAESRYKDWYHVHRFPVDAFGGGKSTTYDAWWDIKDLPKLNTGNPDVRKFLIDVSRYWIEQGVDGWRLDVPNEIDDDEFWAEWRRVVKTANPDAYTVGEIWDGNPRWVGNNHFDGLMHYTLRNAILDLLEGKANLADFAGKMEGFTTQYQRENVYAMYLAMGSHDTRRLITKMGNDLNKVRLAFLLQFSNPGAPAIYYGDEIGLAGERDPDNRRVFPWNPSDWNQELRQYVQRLIAGRKRHAALRRGDLKRIHLSESNSWYAFSRVLGEDKAITAINPGTETRVLELPMNDLALPDGTLFEDIVTGARYRLADQVIKLTLGPWGGVILATLGEV